MDDIEQEDDISPAERHAREILERKPSAAEIAADDARRERVRLDRADEIIERGLANARSEKLQYSLNENALLGPSPATSSSDDDDRRHRLAVATAMAKNAASERLTWDDRKALWAKRLADIMENRIAPNVAKRHFRAAFREVLYELAFGFLSASDRADKIEDRIAALEGVQPSSKPRLRVVAGRRQA